jgi:hypothetical protein
MCYVLKYFVFDTKQILHCKEREIGELLRECIWKTFSFIRIYNFVIKCSFRNNAKIKLDFVPFRFMNNVIILSNIS